MGIISELKTNKDKQNELLDKIAEMPKLVNFVAASINLAARVAAPFWAVYNSASCKYPKQIILLHKLIRDEVEIKRDKYMKLMKEVADSYGFIEHERCDALLFTGLVGAVGFKTQITRAMNKDGSWERRRVDKPCYPHGSRSTISRDMFLGLFWYIWRNQRLDLAEELYDYGTKHNWIMGKGDVSRIYLTPGLQATLAEIIYQLGGSNHSIVRNSPQFWTKGLGGYQAHLEVLHILLRGELIGSITSTMRKTLCDLCSRHMDNHLYTTAKARYSSDQRSANFLGTIAAAGLDDIDLWPRDRLPSDADRSSRWIFENNDRTKGTDPTVGHTGGDLVFCGSLILDYSDVVD